MRLAAIHDDSGFANYARLGPQRHEVRIFLDGLQIQGCVIADDEAGFVVREVRNEHGHVLVDADGCIIHEKLIGEVSIVFPSARH